jgi:hypothetical protein
MSKWFDTLANATIKENVDPQEDLYEEDASMESDQSQDVLDVILDILVELRDLVSQLNDSLVPMTGNKADQIHSLFK